MSQVMARGHVEAFLVGKDGTKVSVCSGSNTLLTAFADAMARLIGGESGYRPTKIGFITSSSSSSVLTQPSRTESVSLGDSFSVEDVDISPNPAYSKSATGSGQSAIASTSYSGNTVALRAALTAGSATQYVYGFMLKDASSRILAVKMLNQVVSLSSGYALSVAWSVTFV